MRIGLISDIHGDPEALELALSHLDRWRVDRIVCAGDLVGYGPFPDRAVALLQERQIPSVRGNHDRLALERGASKADPFGGGVLGEQALRFLESLPQHLLIEGASRVAVVVHGSPSSDMEFVSRSTYPPAVLRRLLRDLECDLLVVGHTHQPMWYRSPGGRLVVNPGSVVSLPVVDSSQTFAVVDLERLEVSIHGVETGAPVSLDPWT
jgi:putative phosphoesterase